MNNFQFEVNKLFSIKDKSLMKDFSSIFKQNLSKKYKKSTNILINQDKSKLEKSTKKFNLTKNNKKETSKQIKSYNTKNNIINNRKNTTRTRNITNNNYNSKNTENKSEKSDIKNKSKNISTTNLSPKENPQYLCLEHILNQKIKNKKINHRNNNNVLKMNFGPWMTNNPNNEGDSIFRNNESYFEVNNIQYSNNKVKNNYNKSIFIEKDNSSKDYLSKVKKHENSSILNSIININKYLTNKKNNKSKDRINRDITNQNKYKKIYENQLIKTHISQDNSRNLSNISKSDFIQDNNIIKNNEDDINNNYMNSDYYCSGRLSKNLKKVIQKKKYFHLDDEINSSSKYIGNIFGFNTPKISINSEHIKTIRFSPKTYNINKTPINGESVYKNNSKNRIKVSKVKFYKNSDENLSHQKENPKVELNEASTKSNSNKNNDLTTERKNSIEIKEFKIINEFDLLQEESKVKKDNSNYIFIQENSQNETKLNNYNLHTCENLYITENNEAKRRKNKNSCYSCIYSPENIHNRFNTIYTQKENKYNYTNIDNDIESNNGNYLKTLEEQGNRRIQEIKINLNISKKKEQPENYLYCNSPSYRLYRHNRYQSNFNNDNNYLKDDYSFEKIKRNNQNVYTKQIFSNYNIKSKSKDKNKNKINKYKINCDDANQLMQFENEPLNKKCIYNNPNNINSSSNNIFQQNNFFTTNNYYNCSSRRSNNNKICSPKIYMKPTSKRNSASNTNLNCSPINRNYSPKNNIESEIILAKTSNAYYKYRRKVFLKKNNYKNNNILNNIKTKVINNNKRCIKYYNYLYKLKPILKPICYISKKVIKTQCKPKIKKNFIIKVVYSIIRIPIIDICFISKTKINISNNRNNKLNNKEKNIIKANILDFSLEKNKELNNEFKNNNHNHNRIIKYIGNEKNYQESFGEINLSFSTEEINSFRQRESTIEGLFSEFINLNSVLMNSESEAKITFCPNVRSNNNNYYNLNNYETTTVGRIIDSSNNPETERTEKNEKTSYKRDEIIKEMKENINLNLNLPFNLEHINNNYDNMVLKTERVHLNSSNDKKIKGMINSKDLINFTETLGNIFEKKKSKITSGYNSNRMKTNYFNDKSVSPDLKINDKNKVQYEIYKANELNDMRYSNFIFENIKNNTKDIKNEIIYLLNIITINNFNEIYEKILSIIKEDLKNLKSFSIIILQIYNIDNKYKILYVILCQNLLNELKRKEKNINDLSDLNNILKKYDDLSQLNTYENYKYNLYLNILSNKVYNINHQISFNFDIFDNINKDIYIIMKNDIINFNKNNQKSIFDYNKIEIFDIIQCYIEICIDLIYDDNKILIKKCNEYINIIIYDYSSRNKNKKKNEEIIDLILNIDNIVVDNKYMYEIMGFLLYCLFIYELYAIENINTFLNKDEYTITNLSKILNYAFFYCKQNNQTNFFIEFQKTKLFHNNSIIFEKYIDN